MAHEEKMSVETPATPEELTEAAEQEQELVEAVEERLEEGEELSADADAPEAAESLEEHPESLEASEAEEIQNTEEAQRPKRPVSPQERVVAAREMVQNTEAEIESCMLGVQQEVEEFERYEQEILEPLIRESKELMERLGDQGIEIEPAVTEVELEDPEEEKLEIQDLSSGKGGAWFWGLLAGVATVGGWYAYAVQKAGESLIPATVPDLSYFSKLAGKVSLLLGPAENPSVGAAVVIGSALVVWWLVYIILVAMRNAKNQRIAQEVEEQAHFYCQKKEECKSKMEEVREHLHSLKNTLQKYEVLLREKNAGLHRAIFIEEAESFDKLHAKSQEMARELQAMLDELKKLLATPMAQSGVLTQESVEALRHAKRVINDLILRLYN